MGFLEFAGATAFGSSDCMVVRSLRKPSERSGGQENVLTGLRTPLHSKMDKPALLVLRVPGLELADVRLYYYVTMFAPSNVAFV